MSVCVCSLKMKFGDSSLDRCVNSLECVFDNKMSFEVLISLEFEILERISVFVFF